MFIIKIPRNDNKYNFVNRLLKVLQNDFNNYEFINCTESPIDEYTYCEYDGIYFRKIKRNFNIKANEANYVDSYEKENLKNQGFTLREYIEMCMLNELEKIIIVSKFDGTMDNYYH